MDYTTFRRVLTSFADSPIDVSLSSDKKMLVQVRDEVIEVEFRRAPDSDGIVCIEGGSPIPASRWIAERLGRLPTLARRILEYIPEDNARIAVGASTLDTLEASPEDKSETTNDALTSLCQLLDSSQERFSTTIIYLTSEAGEGKTNLIDALAREQAKRYIEKQSSWILLPVALGGRPFIRLDDVVVGALSNRFRFPFYYYESVIELVRMGKLVLALDGFEEMFVETSAGDAISSVGNLVSSMQSEGRLLIAARTAFFKFKDLDTQSNLFRTFDNSEVDFGQVSLLKWTRDQFLALADRMKVVGAADLYNTLEARIGSDHPLLTRAVLARRLLLEYDKTLDKARLMDRLSKAAGEEYFEEFVSAMLEREVNEKWLDRSGLDQVVSKPLLSIEGHQRLLGQVAEEMWLSGVEAIGHGVLEALSDLVVESLPNASATTREQARKRITQHALLQMESASKLYSFAHDDFRNYFLGRRVGALLSEKAREGEVRTMLSRNILSDLSVRVATMYALRTSKGAEIVELLSRIATSESVLSFSRVNCGKLAVQLLTGQDGVGTAVQSMLLPADSLEGKSLKNVLFKDCNIEHTSLFKATLREVEFSACSIERFDIPIESKGTAFHNVRFDDQSLPASITFRRETDFETIVDEKYDPDGVKEALKNLGCVVPAEQLSVTFEEQVEEDEDLTTALRAFRAFQRSSAISEDIFLVRLGSQGRRFLDDLLPMLQPNAVEEAPYRGKGTQRRFKLKVSFSRVEECRRLARGSFEKFAELINPK
jgi:hypothetical protein